VGVFPILPRRGRGLFRVDVSPNALQRLGPAAGGMLSAASREHAELPAKHQPSHVLMATGGVLPRPCHPPLHKLLHAHVLCHFLNDAPPLGG
jgi:hypothetical protein